MAPDDFGYGPEETLSHRLRTAPPDDFHPWWDAWRNRLGNRTPILREVTPAEAAAAGAEGVTHVFQSVGDVRIGCRLTRPESRADPPAIVVTSHGYHLEPAEPLGEIGPWVHRGLWELRIRVRGYPGSAFDMGDMTQRQDGWITNGLDHPDHWILGDAVADLANALRVAHTLAGGQASVMLHGESFGGGLAAIAAAVAADIAPIERLALGVPTFGDWAWRAEHPTDVGSGGEITATLAADPSRRQDIERTLTLFDAGLHARSVTQPTLCKLARRDEVVPAPSAAAIFNEIAASRKWRHVVEMGHAHHLPGAMADNRRHVLFEQLAGTFLDPRVDLDQLMETWKDRLELG